MRNIKKDKGEIKVLAYRENLNIKFDNNSCIKNYREALIEADTLRVFFEGGKIEIERYCYDIFKVSISDAFQANVCTEAISSEIKKQHLEIEEDEDKITAKGEAVNAVINKKNLKISFVTREGKILCEDYKPVSRNSEGFFVSKFNDCLAYYGFGEKGGALNKKGRYTENYNTDNPFGGDDETILMYKSIPFYIGLKKESSYGIYLDNTFRSYFDMGSSSKDRLFFGAVSGQIEYYFIPGADIKEVVKKYGVLTGRMEMPPMWSLGYQQCRYSYYTRQEVEGLAADFRKKGIPCDCIYLDIDYMDKYKVMTFNEEKFPEPEKMLKKLEDEGFKVVTIVDPGVKIEDNYGVYERGLEKDAFVKKEDGGLFIGEVWAGKSLFPDYSNEAARRWWKDELKEFMKIGIRGIWNDMNEPAVFDTDIKTMPETCLHNSDNGVMEHKEYHNLYGMDMSRCAKEAQEELRPNVRPFSMTRDTFAGGQRYSSVWTGDNHSTWEDLRMSIPMNCNLGLSGITFLGNDVGGFEKHCTEELFIRWMQLGSFLPIFRNHSAVFTRRQEPWAFGKKAEELAKKAIELRYRLMPYIYNLYAQSNKEGLPVFRPMIMEFPEDMNVIDMYSQFMLGDSMLVAPVLYEGAREKTVYLPEGNWYNYFTYKKYEGGRYYNLEAALDEVPVFIKEGSILPVWEDKCNYIGEKEMKVTFEMFGEGGRLSYYEDDGISFDYKDGKYNVYEIIHKKGEEAEVKVIHKGLDKAQDFKFKYIK